MKIIEFIKKYNKNYNDQNKDWKNDWKNLLEDSKNSNSLTLCFHTLLEQGFPFEYLKEIINYDKKSKEEILSDENTFKWACAFGHPYLIIYLNDKVKVHNIPGAINATFLQYRLDNLKLLEVLGYEKEIYIEPNLCQAISRANQTGCSLNIVEHFLNNIEKFPKLSPYVWNQLENQEWMFKICSGEYEKTFENLLNLKSEKIKNQTLQYAEEIMSIALMNNKTKILEKVMSSYIRNDFVEQYKKVKNKNLKESICIDENKNLDLIIDTYPELIEHKDIKLFMMNNRSFSIDKFITKKRNFNFSEIKKSFIELSKDESCFLRLLKIVNDFDYSKLSIQEAIKISNNIYETKKYSEIDYLYDNEYMTLNRNLFLKNKNFNEFKEEIRKVIFDEKMFELIYKEQLKNNLDNKLGEKPKEKKMKI